MTASSAESNVGSVSSYLGLPVKILTSFIDTDGDDRTVAAVIGYTF